MAKTSATAETANNPAMGEDLFAQVARPLLAWWLWSHDVKLRPAARALKISHEQVRLICLPFDDPKRVVPDAETARRIAHWTGHVVAPWTFEDTPGARAIGISGVSTVGASQKAGAAS